MDKIIHLQGHVDKVETRKDRSVKITIVSAKEITKPEELAQIFSINEEVVSIGMKVGSLSDQDMINIPEPEPDYRGEKPEGQMTRAVIWRMWESRGKEGEFQDYYKKVMSRVREGLKEQI